jgi:hypothetical protein
MRRIISPQAVEHHGREAAHRDAHPEKPRDQVGAKELGSVEKQADH